MPFRLLVGVLVCLHILVEHHHEMVPGVSAVLDNALAAFAERAEMIPLPNYANLHTDVNWLASLCLHIHQAVNHKVKHHSFSEIFSEVAVERQ